MRETATDLERLQTLLSESVDRASAFLRESFEMPAHSLSAAQLSAHLDGALTVALATVTARAEPRVSPIGAVFVRASFCVPTVAESARARHLARRPAASLTYYEGIDMAVIAHGDTENLRLVPATLYTYARYPERFRVASERRSLRAGARTRGWPPARR